MESSIKERCIYCGADVYYTGTEKLIKCGMCGHTLVVAKFENELSRMQQALEEGKKAQQALLKAEEEKQAADDRLFRVLLALDKMKDLASDMEEARTESRESFEELLSAMEKDQALQQSVRDLLESMQTGMQQGQSAIFKVLQKISGDQKNADERLSTLQSFSDRILRSQDDILMRVQLQSDMISRLYAMEMDAAERQELANAFMLQMQQVGEEDTKSLKRIEFAAGAILDSQREVSDKVDQLQQTADRTREAVEAFQSQWQESQLLELRELYHQAENHQFDWAFDKAADYYRQVLVKGGKDAQVYWRLLLCHYCIIYQKDDEGRLIPIILNPDLTDPAHMSVRKELHDHIPPEQKNYYGEELRKIDVILDKYREIRGRVEYDVFISVKQRRDGHYTKDSDVASDLYDFLTEKGLKVFNSRRTVIPAGQEYEPYIISALMSSKALIVVGTSVENMNAQWVKNEWTRFGWLQRTEKKQSGKTDRLMFCYLADGMQPNEIPKALNPDKQAIMDGVKAYSKLLKSLDFLLKKRKKDIVFATPENTSSQMSFNRISNQMTVWLFQEKYDKVLTRYDELTEAGSFLTHARLHLYALCAQKHMQNIEQLVRSQVELCDEPLFMLAQTLCIEEDDKKRLASYLEQNIAWHSSQEQKAEKTQNNGSVPDKKPLSEKSFAEPDKYSSEDSLGWFAEQWYKKAAEALKNGDSVAAFTAFSKSAGTGNLQAMLELGKMYQSGYGVPENLREAEKYYAQAADKGYEPAIDALSDLKKQWKYKQMMAEDWYRQGVTRTRQGQLQEAFELFRNAAEAGNIQAQNHLGVCYRNGQGVLKNDKEAVAWYRKAANHGYAIAQTNLGVCYYNGQGIKKNRTVAAKWFQKSADQGFAHAQYMLGLCNEKGAGLPIDLQKALTWYRLAASQDHADAVKAVARLEKELKEKKEDSAELFRRGRTAEVQGKYTEAVQFYRRAAELGSADAQNWLGLCYDNGTGVAQNNTEAARWYKKAAEQGNSAGQHNYGICLEVGRGVAQNTTEAVMWYRRSAEQGFPNAYNKLGLCYENGIGVAKNNAEAARWYKKAAEQGDSAGQHNYGLCLEEGRGVAKNTTEAVTWYRRSAEQGFPHAYNRLGLCYDSGKGVSQNKKEAVTWYRKAAEKGHGWGQYNYGLYLEKGIGVSKNPEEAVSWYLKAAEQGIPNAQNNLGQCLEKGIGCVIDKVEARKWYEKAAAQNYEPAQKNLNRMTKKKWF